jgi:hypothetical protein
MKRSVRVYTWTRALNGRTVRDPSPEGAGLRVKTLRGCRTLEERSRTRQALPALQDAGLERITASLEIGETINPVLVTAALEKMGVVLYFDGQQYRAPEAA